MTRPVGSQARVIWSGDDMTRALSRIAHEILERNHGTEGLLLLGIPTRGVPLGRRLAAVIAEAEGGAEVPTGELDVTMYRDDLPIRPTLAVGRTRIPGGTVDGRVVVLVDDVLNSGRTIAAAIDALKDLGRPRAVRLAVLIDRGDRELPIRADHIGRELSADAGERVTVRVCELDDVDSVTVEPKEG